MGQGWDPITDFLGKPKLDKPFPHTNKGGDITREILLSDPPGLVMSKVNQG